MNKTYSFNEGRMFEVQSKLIKELAEKKTYGRRWGNYGNYHLSIDSSYFPLEECAQLFCL